MQNRSKLLSLRRVAENPEGRQVWRKMTRRFAGDTDSVPSFDASINQSRPHGAKATAGLHCGTEARFHQPFHHRRVIGMCRAVEPGEELIATPSLFLLTSFLRREHVLRRRPPNARDRRVFDTVRLSCSSTLAGHGGSSPRV